MSRPHRTFEAATSYHVTMRCNNQAFDLRRPQARQVILFCLARARTKFGFDLFGLCVMSNQSLSDSDQCITSSVRRGRRRCPG